MSTIVWFRNDLRLSDNPALYEAALKGAIVPLYIWSPNEEGAWPPGEASKWWLHQSLLSLEKALEEKGLFLLYMQGPSINALKKLIKDTKAQRVFWNRRYEPFIIQRDKEIEEELKLQGIEVNTYNGSLLIEPWDISTKEKKPFQVFTAFWKTALKHPVNSPLPNPRKIKSFSNDIQYLELSELKLLPEINWAKGIESEWIPGEKSAIQKFKQFVKKSIYNYGSHRDFPHMESVSRMSPYLHFGEITPRIIYYEIIKNVSEKNINEISTTYIRQLYWREFAYHLLFHFPFTTENALKKKFNKFPWNNDKNLLQAWQNGRTGYPIVDAGMKQLLTTGWMHNRVRLITASFLTKDLLLPWQMGSRWFWDTLVDADLANNTLGWQWVAGCGADAAPFFRIFNPVTQGKKFDPEGDYIRKWIPALKKLSNQWIHNPWEASLETLQKADIVLGKNYPYPIVNHKEARTKALSAFDKIKKESSK